MIQQPEVTVVDGGDDPFNEGAAAIGNDGSMVLMKNSNIFQGSLQTSTNPGTSKFHEGSP